MHCCHRFARLWPSVVVRGLPASKCAVHCRAEHQGWPCGRSQATPADVRCLSLAHPRVPSFPLLSLLSELMACWRADHVRDLQRASHVRGHPGRAVPVRLWPHHWYCAGLWRWRLPHRCPCSGPDLRVCVLGTFSEWGLACLGPFTCQHPEDTVTITLNLKPGPCSHSKMLNSRLDGVPGLVHKSSLMSALGSRHGLAGSGPISAIQGARAAVDL